ncbi:MAG TPA: sortase [Aggregatilineales bacterium]|nr:sortase [Aggregatilineales bacterium]
MLSILPLEFETALLENTILSIPRLEIESILFEMELRPQHGSVVWYISPWERRAGHLEGTPRPGEEGNVVIGAHAEMVNGEPGLFARLPELKSGYIIRLTQENHIYEYVVSEIKIVAFNDLSVVTEQQNRLTLITCNGDYDPEQRGYATRLVVIADPILEN